MPGERAKEAGRPPEGELWESIDRNLEALHKVFGASSDVVFREFRIADGDVRAAVVYIDGLVDKNAIQRELLKGLMLESAYADPLERGPLAGKGEPEAPSSFPGTRSTSGGPYPMKAQQAFAALKARAIAIGEVKEAKSLPEAVEEITSGNSIFLLEGSAVALSLSTRGWKERGIEEPLTEALVRGPRDGFIETLRTNTALLRRKLRDADLRIEALRVGRRSQTDCALVYIERLTDPGVVKEVKARLEKIDVDHILETGYIEQFIEDNWYSPFPQAQYTERPDKVVAAVLEGRVAILVDGTPFALLVPAVFGQFFQSPEDYYERWLISSFIRFLRVVASYVATFSPSLYVALTSYHPELLPTSLAITLAAARQGVPYPVWIEAMLMELAFELFREAGARLPRTIGQTLSIVGGLIVGEAAVRAGLSSNPMVIVVAFTAIASFVIPSYSMAISFRMLRFPLLFVAAFLGLYGVMLGFIVINIHMVGMKAMGTTYLAPFVPYRWTDWKDLLVRIPWPKMNRRATVFSVEDQWRQGRR